jgi:hypothetical protein
MQMKYENSDTFLQQLCMKFVWKSHKTEQISEWIGQRAPSPSLFTLHLPPLLSLAVTMETRDRVISPRFTLRKYHTVWSPLVFQVWKTVASILGLEASDLDWGLYNFLLTLQAKAGMVFQIGYGHFEDGCLLGCSAV